MWVCVRRFIQTWAWIQIYTVTRGFLDIPVIMAANPSDASISFYIIWTFACHFLFLTKHDQRLSYALLILACWNGFYILITCGKVFPRCSVICHVMDSQAQHCMFMVHFSPLIQQKLTDWDQFFFSERFSGKNSRSLPSPIPFRIWSTANK